MSKLSEVYMIKTKTIKTPLMMAESVALSYCPITIVPESKLSHMATVHYGFVPKLNHHGGKTVKTERRSQTCSYTALHFIGKRLRFFSLSEVFLFCSD
jgi:hypothetical protein